MRGTSPMDRATREIHFCYGHRLLDYVRQCRPHQRQNGLAVLPLEAPALDAKGMLVDFGEIKQKLQRWIDETLDHAMILCRRAPLLPLLRERGERVYVMEDNPTAE